MENIFNNSAMREKATETPVASGTTHINRVLGLMLGLNVVFTKGSLTRPMLTLKFASRDGVMFEIMLSVVKEGSIVGGSKRNGG